MVIQTALFVAFLARVAISLRRLCLAAHGPVGRAAVGRIFLIRNNLSQVIELKAGRTEVIAELVADELAGRLVATCRVECARLDKGEAPCVVHYMQRLSLQSDRVTPDRPTVLAVDLAAPDIEALFDKARGLLPHFTHALACCVVHIKARATTSQVRLAQLVFVVPVHVRPGHCAAQVWHAQLVAVGVMQVRLWLRSVSSRVECGARQAVAILWQRCAAAVVDQAGFEVVIGTRPARMRHVTAAMLHLQEISDGIQDVALDVGTHGIAVVRGELPNSIGAGRAPATAIVERVGDGAATLAEVFAAGGLDQAIERVVGVIVAGLDPLVPEVDGLLCIVLDMGDVTGRVICVVQVLHLFAWPVGNGWPRIVTGEVSRPALGQQLGEPQGERVVAVDGTGAVLVVDALAPAFGVVVDVGDSHR